MTGGAAWRQAECEQNSLQGGPRRGGGVGGKKTITDRSQRACVLWRAYPRGVSTNRLYVTGISNEDMLVRQATPLSHHREPGLKRASKTELESYVPHALDSPHSLSPLFTSPRHPTKLQIKCDCR